MKTYLGVEDASSQLDVPERTIRGWAERFEWFGGKLGDPITGAWVFTQEEIDRMRSMPKLKRGRPKKAAVG